MYDDRLEIYSPGGMMDGQLIQQLSKFAKEFVKANRQISDFGR
jgi:predicted HTH transcriptional regulator